MSEPENYDFTRAKIRADRRNRIKADVTTAALVLIPAALGGLVHVGWALTFAACGFAVDALYFRRDR